MHIIIKNKKLIINNYKVKCAVGKRGITARKKEGDYSTPKGIYKLKEIFYRGDKVQKLKTKLKKTKITRKMGWCDSPKSTNYNKLIKFPFQESAEKLYRNDSIYDIIIITNYNMNPIIRGKGSAIFLHIARNNYKPTRGCIAISKRNMRSLLLTLKLNTKLIVY